MGNMKDRCIIIGGGDCTVDILRLNISRDDFVVCADAGFDIAEEAFQKGAKHVTHLYNAMNPINHRNPGPIIAASDDEICIVAYQRIRDSYRSEYEPRHD